MNRLVFILFLLLNSLSCFSQEDYSIYLGEGKARYERGMYIEAKEHFESMMVEFPARKSEISVWVQKCDTAIKRKREEEAERLREKERLERECLERQKEEKMQSEREESYSKGMRYFLGLQYEEAIDCFQKAAALGHDTAQYKLGEIYEEGYGTPVNDKEAVTWYIKAAKQGYDVAQVKISKIYYHGSLGVKQNYQESIKWFEKAADQKNSEALRYIGMCHENGFGVEKNDIEAIKYYRVAANLANADAQNNLGLCYFNGIGVKQDYEKAFACFRKAVYLSLHSSIINNEMMYNLAYCYENGMGVFQSYDAAIYWYKKTGHQKAFARMRKVMDLSEKSRDSIWNSLTKKRVDVELPTNTKEEKLYKQAINTLEYDWCKGLEYLKKSADMGYRVALYHLAIAFKYGKYGLKKDSLLAMNCCELSAKRGYRDAVFLMAYTNEEAGNFEEAIYWYKEDVKLGGSSSCCRIGLLYKQRNMLNEAMFWFQKGEVAGDVDALYYLGAMHYYQENYKEAIRSFKRLIDYELSERKRLAGYFYAARSLLAYCYANGTGVDRDLDKAFELTANNEEQLSSIDYEIIGMCFSEGVKGFTKNDFVAFHYFKKAADLGLKTAMLKVANCYKIGCGVFNIDEDEYNFWISKEKKTRRSLVPNREKNDSRK